MADLKMLRQVMTTTELFSHGEGICDMLREQYGTYDADSLEEVLVDETFVQRLKSKGYEVFGEGDPRTERSAQRRPLPRLGLPSQSRPRDDNGPRMPTARNGSGVPNRPMNDRAPGNAARPTGGSTPFRLGANDGSRSADGSMRANGGTGNTQRPIRSGGLPLRPAERSAPERPTAGIASPVPEVPAAEVPELPVPGQPVAPMPNTLVAAELPVQLAASPETAASPEALPNPPRRGASPSADDLTMAEQSSLMPDVQSAVLAASPETANAPVAPPATKSRARAPKAAPPLPSEAAEAPPAKPRRSTRKRVEPTEE